MFIFTEEETGFIMELRLEGDQLVGLFTEPNEKTEYEAKLILTPSSKTKIARLDNILEEYLK